MPERRVWWSVCGASTTKLLGVHGEVLRADVVAGRAPGSGFTGSGGCPVAAEAVAVVVLLGGVYAARGVAISRHIHRRNSQVEIVLSDDGDSRIALALVRSGVPFLELVRLEGNE